MDCGKEGHEFWVAVARKLDAVSITDIGSRIAFIFRQVPAGFVESDRTQITVAALEKERGSGILRGRDRRHSHLFQSGDPDMMRQVVLMRPDCSA
jgi:hypothetical protein